MPGPRDSRGGSNEGRDARARAKKLRAEARRIRARALAARMQAAAARRIIEKLPPTDPAARDEGPRLIPFRNDARSSQPFGRALDLGDIALGNKKRR